MMDIIAKEKQGLRISGLVETFKGNQNPEV